MAGMKRGSSGGSIGAAVGERRPVFEGSYLESICHRLRVGEVSRELGENFIHQQRKPEVAKRLVDGVTGMGWQVAPAPASHPAAGGGSKALTR